MPTIRDVAERAGVSPSTVSHVINQTRYVSPAVAERVRQAMADLHYTPNRLARSLRRKTTHTIGLITPDNANPFFAQLAQAVEEICFQQGYTVLLGNAAGDLDRELRYIQVMLEKQVDGLIVVASGLSSEHLRALIIGRTPVVLVDRDLPDVRADRVLSDHRQGGRIATDHLLGLGHRRIGCITGPKDVSAGNERVAGYRDALAAAHIPVDASLIVPGTFDLDSGYQAMLDLLSLPEPPTGVFAANDQMAVGALRALQERGVSTPEGCSLVGYDDIPLASYVQPPLTTVRQPVTRLGQLAVETLLARIADPDRPLQCHRLPVELVERASCARVTGG
ncbi:MAG: LacI family transcriptional regulator [Caldilineae bacterium]|nr:MAG: LacI family transcriptional regulator [Caldilineae bacterium]